MAETTKSKMPKGGAKGGTRFPLVALPKALEYCTRLVSKTHAGPLPENIILTGVFDSATSAGKVRASALKQYGLLEGKSSGYSATELAKSIGAAPSNEKAPLIAKAFLAAKVFKTLFDTFHGDEVSTAKIRQKVLGEKVHPDVADKCVGNFIDGAIACALGSASTDGIKLKSLKEVGEKDAEGAETPETVDAVDAKDGDGEESDGKVKEEKAASTTPKVRTEKPSGFSGKRASAPFSIDLKLDASMDPEKLEKLMQVLSKYGAV